MICQFVLRAFAHLNKCVKNAISNDISSFYQLDRQNWGTASSTATNLELGHRKFNCNKLRQNWSTASSTATNSGRAGGNVL